MKQPDKKNSDYRAKLPVYTHEHTEAAYLLGGIGTGNVSVGSRGEYRDWEIFNRSGKGNKMPYTFFALRVQDGDGAVSARILEAELQPPFTNSHGFPSEEVAGLPRFRRSEMRGGQPFVTVDLQDDLLPVEVSMEAFTPFIPLNAKDSGLPVFRVSYEVRNSSDGPVDVSVAGSLSNGVGFGIKDTEGQSINKTIHHGGLHGVEYTREGLPDESPVNGSMFLATPDETASIKPRWLIGGWYDAIHDFWDDFVSDGELDSESDFDAPGNDLYNQRTAPGSVCLSRRIAPGDSHAFTFYVSWYFPYRVAGWEEQSCKCVDGDCGASDPVKNYYSTHFGGATEVAAYAFGNERPLEEASRLFEKTLWESSFPAVVLDAISANCTVIRSSTCFRLADGTLYGWEGCDDDHGCCPGTCTHVWNYAQTCAFLFPELERTMRVTEFTMDTDSQGAMDFRSIKSFENEVWNSVHWYELPPAVDGQLGTIARLYREWLLSRDDDFLRRLWPTAKLSLNYAIEAWDTDSDGVPEGKQHTTYDIEFYGKNPLTASMFLLALRCAEEMSRYLGEGPDAKRYRELFEIGSRNTDELLFNGEYYEQQIEDVNAFRYQHGKGCLADQLLGQFLAHVFGLGYLLPQDHVRSAVEAIYRYNFVREFHSHANAQRTFALNDEEGLVLCTWPLGGRPRLPFVYSDEAWTGVEYEVAALLIYEGMVDEGIDVVRAVRNRYDGYKRNPWDEVECGHHYVRSMASWALLLALSGFSIDRERNGVSFVPVGSGDTAPFNALWSNGVAWGSLEMAADGVANSSPVLNVAAATGDLPKLVTPGE